MWANSLQRENTSMQRKIKELESENENVKRDLHYISMKLLGNASDFEGLGYGTQGNLEEEKMMLERVKEFEGDRVKRVKKFHDDADERLQNWERIGKATTMYNPLAGFASTAPPRAAAQPQPSAVPPRAYAHQYHEADNCEPPSSSSIKLLLRRDEGVTTTFAEEGRTCDSSSESSDSDSEATATVVNAVLNKAVQGKGKKTLSESEKGLLLKATESNGTRTLRPRKK